METKIVGLQAGERPASQISDCEFLIAELTQTKIEIRSEKIVNDKCRMVNFELNVKWFPPNWGGISRETLNYERGFPKESFGQLSINPKSKIKNPKLRE